jgi:hypothetical protein
VWGKGAGSPANQSGEAHQPIMEAVRWSRDRLVGSIGITPQATSDILMAGRI